MSDINDSVNQFNTPILFIVFNRKDITLRAFNEIRKQQPKYLYVAADGPRPHIPDEKEKCEAVRDIFKSIDWDCELKVKFNENNLGCGKAPKSAISWFFDNVEQGIILEDDCIAHQDFFPYCEEMLNYYKDQEEIMVISGDNFQDGLQRGTASYYFSAYPITWGWASWHRAWKNYDFYLDDYSLTEFKNSIKFYNFRWNQRQMWIDKFLSMKKRGYDAWDYQFSFHIWKNRGLCIIPNKNLVSNIGFGDTATHTTNDTFSALNIKTAPILPIIHTEKIVQPNLNADNYYYFKYLHKPILQLIWRTIKRIFFLKPKFERS